MRSHGGFGLFRLLEPLAPQQDVPADEPQMNPEIPPVGPEGGRHRSRAVGPVSCAVRLPTTLVSGGYA